MKRFLLIISAFLMPLVALCQNSKFSLVFSTEMGTAEISPNQALSAFNYPSSNQHLGTSVEVMLGTEIECSRIGAHYLTMASFLGNEMSESVVLDHIGAYLGVRSPDTQSLSVQVGIGLGRLSAVNNYCYNNLYQSVSRHGWGIPFNLGVTYRLTEHMHAKLSVGCYAGKLSNQNLDILGSMANNNQLLWSTKTMIGIELRR